MTARVRWAAGLPTMRALGEEEGRQFEVARPRRSNAEEDCDVDGSPVIDIGLRWVKGSDGDGRADLSSLPTPQTTLTLAL